MQIARIGKPVWQALFSFLVFGILPNLVAPLVLRYSLYAVGLLLAGILFYRLSERSAKEARAGLEVDERQRHPGQRKGLIVLSSPGGKRRLAAENAIEAHLGTMRHCWIIAGPNPPVQPPPPAPPPEKPEVAPEPTSRQNADSMATRYHEAHPEVQFDVLQLDDEHNPAQSFGLVTSIYQQAAAFGLREEDVIADYTGGTKSMTAGMVLACSASETRDAQYMRAHEVTPAGLARRNSTAEPVLVDLNFI